jgi:bacterial surface protein 26-residue repeat protein (3 repeats) (fragment)
MKMIGFTLRKVFASIIVMLCALFASPRVSGQTLEAYVQRNPEKTTLTFYYDDRRATRTGDTWGIDEKNGYLPAWVGTTITKVVFDASFKNFQPTTTNRWFSRCRALTTFEGWENLNTEKVKDMGYMFAYCDALETLDLKTFNTQNVEDVYEMFYMCSALKTVHLESFNTGKVKTMFSMFYGCKSLETLNLKHFNTEKVETMSGMFGGCKSLKTLDITSFNTEKVGYTKSMFSGCSALETLDLTSFDTRRVENMEEMFSHCTALKQLDLSGFSTNKLEETGRMFKGCEQLTTLISNSVWKCKWSNDMFKGCTQLKGAVAYDGEKTDVTMANPETGYFTGSKLEAYVLQNPEKTTLTFYYDGQRAKRTGTTWDINEKHSIYYTSPMFMAWTGTYESPNTTITKVVFDASFKDYRPVTTGSWFRYLQALTTFEGWENLHTEQVNDMSYMFEHCTALKTLDLTSFNTQKVETMEQMFSNCTELTALNLKNFNTANVENMAGLFSECSALTELDLKSFDTENVKDMAYLFGGCRGLKTIDVKHFNTAKVGGMSNMFAECSMMKTLDLANFNTEQTKFMAFMFYGCSALKTLDLRNFNTEKAFDMSGMFKGCGKLTGIISEKTWQCLHSEGMFKGCTRLKGAVAYDADKTDVKMANPETGYFRKNAPENVVEAYVLQNPDKTTLTFYYDPLRNTRTGTTWDIDETDAEYKYLSAWAGTEEHPNTTTTKVVFDASFQNYRPTTMFGWFFYYKALTTIEGLEYLNTENVTNMGSLFKGCSALTELDLTHFNTANVTYMGQMFEGCATLKTLDLKSFNTTNVEGFYDMFRGCIALETIDLSNFNTSNVKSMFAMFYQCSALKSIDLKSFNTSNVTNMTSMFADCKALTSLDLRSFDMEKVEQMVHMFSGCKKLSSIVSDKTWQCLYSEDMFKGCTQLKGAVAYDPKKTDVTMANPETGYFVKNIPTAVGQVQLNGRNTQGIYTLQGKRVNTDFKHLPAGVYIVNGKKMVR